MSDRANYAIIHRKRLTVYYAAWGGPTIQRELKDGPVICERFIRKQERVRNKRFLDFAYMEGAIALDKDKKQALFFGGPGDINYNPDVQKRLVERLLPIWEKEGWTISWATRYAYDFVRFLGFPETDIEYDHFADHPAEWPAVIKEPLEWVSTIFAFKHGDTWDLRASESAPRTLIHHGERLVTARNELPRLATIDLTSAGSATTLVFEESQKRLALVTPLFGSLNMPHILHNLARKVFPGWTVELDLDVPLPYKRLQSRGITIPLETQPELVEPPSRDEIDSLLDRALVYAPEEQIAALEEAKAAIIANINQFVDPPEE